MKETSFVYQGKRGFSFYLSSMPCRGADGDLGAAPEACAEKLGVDILETPLVFCINLCKNRVDKIFGVGGY